MAPLYCIQCGGEWGVDPDCGHPDPWDNPPPEYNFCHLCGANSSYSPCMQCIRELDVFTGGASRTIYPVEALPITTDVYLLPDAERRVAKLEAELEDLKRRANEDRAFYRDAIGTMLEALDCQHGDTDCYSMCPKCWDKIDKVCLDLGGIPKRCECPTDSPASFHMDGCPLYNG